MKRIYLDHAATTPLRPEALAAMRPWLEAQHGNPSSMHADGRAARQAIDEAREVLSDRLACRFAEVVFTSSGTEAANLAILGSALANLDGIRRRILLSRAEHHCVLHTAPLLDSLGFSVEHVEVDANARLKLDDLQKKLDETVSLVAVMHANNEVGTIQPVGEVAELCQARGSLFFCDAVQTFGALPWTVDELGADLISVSAHKINGPKGAGALYIRAGTKVRPLTVGGGQERELRAGTENTAAIVGFAAASRLCTSGDGARRSAARDAFLGHLTRYGGVEWTRTVEPAVETLSGHAHIRFPGVTAESMLIVLDRMGVSASSGSACSSGSLEPSHVLLASGLTESEASEGLRFTFGSSNTIDEAREAAGKVAEAASSIVASRPRVPGSP